MAEVNIEKRFEFFQDYIKTILNLSTGALVFSITFLHDIVGIGSEHGAARPVQFRGLLGFSWIAIFISICAALAYLYFHALVARGEGLSRGYLKWTAIAALCGFLLGLVALGSFGWLNI